MKNVYTIGFILCALAIGARAETVKAGMYTYNYRVKEGKALLTIDFYGGRKVAAITPSPQGEFTVPSKLNGLPVIIGSAVFADCENLTSIVIPNDVTINSSSSSLVLSCNNLARFVVDAEHPQLASLDGILYDKKMKTLIRFPEGKGGAYEIPEGVVSIQDGAFSSCSKLTSVTLPSSLVKLGDRTFKSGTGVFDLSSILVHPDNTAYSSVDGVLFDKEKTTLIICPVKNVKKPGHYVIPDGVRVIGNGAFSCCHNLTSVVIPESVASIGEGAFFQCDNLASMTIPKSVISIGELAFHACRKLTTVNLKCAKPQKEAKEVLDKTPATKLIAPKDMGWKNGEKFWGKPVEVR